MSLHGNRNARYVRLGPFLSPDHAAFKTGLAVELQVSRLVSAAGEDARQAGRVGEWSTEDDVMTTLLVYRPVGRVADRSVSILEEPGLVFDILRPLDDSLIIQSTVC